MPRRQPHQHQSSLTPSPICWRLAVQPGIRSSEGRQVSAYGRTDVRRRN